MGGAAPGLHGRADAAGESAGADRGTEPDVATDGDGGDPRGPGVEGWGVWGPRAAARGGADNGAGVVDVDVVESVAVSDAVSESGGGGCVCGGEGGRGLGVDGCE